MIIHDENNIPQLIEVLEELGELEIEIGVLGDGKGGEKYENGGGEESKVTVAQIANYHEFGKGHNPERSFIRASFDKNLDEYTRVGEKLIGQALELQVEADGVAEALGEHIVGKTQEFLTDLKSPPLKPATIARKKSSNPLIDTGQLRDSIEWKKV